MRVLAASVAAQGGEIQTSRILWAEIARSAENDAIRHTAQIHLAALDTQGALKKLDGLIALYQQGRAHTSLISGFGSRPDTCVRFRSILRESDLPLAPMVEQNWDRGRRLIWIRTVEEGPASESPESIRIREACNVSAGVLI